MRKTVLITGTSKGIGYALALQFLAQGYTVIGTSRSGKIETVALSNIQVLSLDLENQESIKKTCKYFEDSNESIDILINNAGIGPDLDTLKPDMESFSRTFAVNVTGTVFLTEQLLSFINVGGKIINITSKMGSIGLCELTDSVAYRMSKAGLNMYTKILTNRLKGKQLVASVHPGWVRTTIAKSNVHGRLSADESAKKIIDFVLSDFNTGIFWNVETQSTCNW